MQKCYLTMTMCVFYVCARARACIMCIICMHTYSGRADIVQVLVTALFSVTDFTVVKLGVSRKYKQCNGLHVQNVSKVMHHACLFFLLKLIKEDPHVSFIHMWVASQSSTRHV
jgi:hypothetical protein